MALCNPGLTRLISDAIGDGWIRDLNELRKIEPFARDAEFRKQWRQVKVANKRALAGFVSRTLGVDMDPESMFDVQVKRIHEYKRQHLNVLHVITLYNRLKRGWRGVIAPRTFIFGGKAAPGYFMAKLIIKLINSVAEVINGDRSVRETLRVVFIPDFNVKNAQRIYPAADLSEQISTAGKEASGTGNMKFALNGALTMGTLDGANIEIRDEVGKENFFLFGLTAEEVADWKGRGYEPGELYRGNHQLREVLDLIAGGELSPSEPQLFAPLVRGLLDYGDNYMLLADFDAYVSCQQRVSAAYRDPEAWTRSSILNVARMGRFSSDRTIREYARDIWGVKPMPVTLPDTKR
jgi:starch phosphorylase